MAPSERGIAERPLETSDIPAGLRLSEQAGWNQVAADWAYLLRAGTGFGIVDDERGLLATAVVLPYDAGFGWISMVLVDREARGRGLASRLLRRARALLGQTGRIPLVDATPAGRAVYAGMGFCDTRGIRRLRATHGAAFTAFAAADPAVRVRTAQPHDLDALASLDADAFGAPRPALLAELRRRMPELALIAERDGEPRGFVLARDGRTATQLGPLVAHDDGVARALLACALRATGPAVIVDVFDARPDLQRDLLLAGFTEERPFTRMVHGRALRFGRERDAYAIAGPELG